MKSISAERRSDPTLPPCPEHDRRRGRPTNAGRWVGTAACLAGLLAGHAAPSWAGKANGTHWAGVKHACTGYGTGKVSAKLEGIPWGWSWEEQCNQYPPAFNQHGASGKPVCRKDALSTGIWGEWTVRNDTACLPRWEALSQAGCVGPNKQVYSSKLLNIIGKDWKQACEETAGPGNRGKPDNCSVKSTGVWGEWYDANTPCAKPLAWGEFKDNGCVKDMGTADSNLAGVDIQSKRSYSAVLWNGGGDWIDACRQAAANVPNGRNATVEFAHPTACTIVDADRPLSYAIGGVLGGLSGAATLPAGGAGAAIGVAVAIASQAAGEAILANVDTGLNVWGIFWMDDASCGPVPEYEPLDDSGKVLLSTGEISSHLAPR